MGRHAIKKQILKDTIQRKRAYSSVPRRQFPIPYLYPYPKYHINSLVEAIQQYIHQCLWKHEFYTAWKTIVALLGRASKYPDLIFRLCIATMHNVPELNSPNQFVNFFSIYSSILHRTKVSSYTTEKALYYLSIGDVYNAIACLETYLTIDFYKNHMLLHGYLGMSRLCEWIHRQGITVTEWRKQVAEHFQLKRDLNSRPTLDLGFHQAKQSLQTAYTLFPMCDYFLEYYTDMLVYDDDISLALDTLSQHCENHPTSVSGWRLYTKLLHQSSAPWTVQRKAWLRLVEMDPTSNEAFLSLLYLYRADRLDPDTLINVVLIRLEIDYQFAHQLSSWKLLAHLLYRRQLTTTQPTPIWLQRLHMWKLHLWNAKLFKHHLKRFDKICLIIMWICSLLLFGRSLYSLQCTKFFLEHANHGELEYYTNLYKVHMFFQEDKLQLEQLRQRKA